MPFRDRAKGNAYARVWTREARWHAAGNCIRCGLPAGTNPHTGTPFHRCFDCRRKQAASQTLYQRARRAKAKEHAA